MAPWSPAAAPSSPPEGYLANHHRRSSSNLPLPSSSGSSRNKLKKFSKDHPEREAVEEVEPEDDPWGDDSDDEAAVAALAKQQHKLGNLSISSSSGAAGPSSSTSPTRSAASSTSPTSPAAAPASSSSWSFFSIIAPTPKPAPPPVESDVVSGPQAVAAVLSGQTVRPAPVAVASRTTSYLASASKVQEEADKVVEEEEREKGNVVQTASSEALHEGDEEEAAAEAPDAPAMRRGSSYQMDLCKAAIKSDVEEIVKDPVSLLARLPLYTPAPPPTVPESPIVPLSQHRGSISSAAGTEPDDDEDDDPAAGYMQLDATNMSSGAPEIVEFNKEIDPEEEGADKGRERRRRRKFVECLGADNVDLAELRSLAWSGIPDDIRPMAWQLLLGYLPAPSSRRLSTLARKRQEYADAVRLAFSRGVKGLDGPIWHQISIDVPRTNAGVRLWQGEGTQRSLERILYVWAIRHPASGYVQGINDLVTPFFQVFLSSYIDTDPESYDVSALPPSVLEALEADSFWCLSKLLDGIQDNYIFAQPGITRQVARMKELCARVDAPLAHHLEENNVEFIQFAFRWMNCLLMREMNVKNIVRMWDTYLAEGGDAFSEFHLYVCLAFLVKWSDQLREMDFQSIIMFLQSLPTQDWNDKNIELLLSEAFMWSRTFEAR